MNMFVAESSVGSLIKIMLNILKWWIMPSRPCSYLGLRYLLHYPFDECVIERTIEYFKDRTECFHECYPCKNNIQYDLTNVHNRLGLFVFVHNAVILHLKFMTLVSSIQIHSLSGKNLKSTMFLRNSTRIFCSEITGDCPYLYY